LTSHTTGGVTSYASHDPVGCEDNDDVLNINELYVTQVSDPGNEDDTYDGSSGTLTLHNPSNNGVGDATFGANYVQISVTSFSEFWIHGLETAAALPVELLNFEASTISEKSILLNWRTLTEINNAGFEVQRSSNGLDFEKVSLIDGNGNTNEVQNYKLIDEGLNNGTFYYRLKQIDFDGKFEYSAVVNASIKGAEGVLVSYFMPNPAADDAKLNVKTSVDTKLQIEILDNLGRLISSIEVDLIAGKQSINFNTSDYAVGVYTAKILLNNQEYSRKLVVRK
jgi:hypothetical protein